ncbi:MAG TPA: hypothetical protein VFD49_09265 [Candidatus Dormibacteraeota bacterium]|nr:hypothetical protein [Candidatus Dormibacteraeota bacterium]
MLDPRAFRLTTPRELEALERGEPLDRRPLADPVAVQACSEEAEAAVLRGLTLAPTCRLVRVPLPARPK